MSQNTEVKEPAARTLPSEMSVTDALALAIDLIRGGDVNPGIAICDRVLAAVPDQPDALHYKGMALYHTGHVDDGVSLIRRALEVAPRYTAAWNNLGNILAINDAFDKAAQAYRHVITLEPTHADAWNNLAAALKEQDKLDEAMECVKKALELDPKHPEAYHTLGNIYRQQKRDIEALAAFKQALVLHPRHADSYRGLGAAFYAVGQVEEAADVYRRWLQIEPENPYPAHMLAACTNDHIPERASDAYVAGTFDRFANSFDKVLEKLQYRAPQLLAHALHEHLGTTSGTLAVADAGCGTGLCGPLLRPFARTLVGVDLSEKMVARAKERESEGRPIYDELVVDELTAFFAKRPSSYDVVISADTLCYFGNLQPPVQALAASLKPGGVLGFTVERAPDSEQGYVLHPHGRYSQTEAYVKSVLQAAGLQIATVKHVHLRVEKGSAVDGLLVLAQAPQPPLF